MARMPGMPSSLGRSRFATCSDVALRSRLRLQAHEHSAVGRPAEHARSGRSEEASRYPGPSRERLLPSCVSATVAGNPVPCATSVFT